MLTSSRQPDLKNPTLAPRRIPMRLTTLASKAVTLCFGAMVLVGCGSGDPGTGDPGTGDPGTGDPGNPGDPPAGGPGVATSAIGPFDIASGEERTVCVIKRLDNTEDMVAKTF